MQKIKNSLDVPLFTHPKGEIADGVLTVPTVSTQEQKQVKDDLCDVRNAMARIMAKDEEKRLREETRRNFVREKKPRDSYSSPRSRPSGLGFPLEYL